MPRRRARRGCWAAREGTGPTQTRYAKQPFKSRISARRAQPLVEELNAQAGAPGTATAEMLVDTADAAGRQRRGAGAAGSCRYWYATTSPGSKRAMRTDVPYAEVARGPGERLGSRPLVSCQSAELQGRYFIALSPRWPARPANDRVETHRRRGQL